MRAFYAVARREFLDKRFVLIAAAVAAVIPLIVPLVRNVPGIDAKDVRQWVAIILSASIAAGVALAMGATVLAGEVANRRIGFFFSRPISSFALWAGKLAGGLALAVASLGIALGPTLLVEKGLPPLRDLAGTTSRGVALTVGGLFLIILVMNAIFTIVHSRSWLAVVDLAACSVILLVGWAAWTPLARGLLEPPAWWITIGEWPFLTVVTTALLVGGFRAVSRGRTDTYAAHRAFSTGLWTTWGVVVAIFFAYSRWVLAATPSSLKSQYAGSLGSSGWVTLEGRARGIWTTFLYDLKSSRFERKTGFTWPAVSANGKLAAWPDAESHSGPWFIRTLRLDEPGASSKATNIALTAPEWGLYPHQVLYLSPDGDRIATVGDGLLSVFDLASGHSLGSARVADPKDFVSAFFPSRDEVRIFRYRSGPDTEAVAVELLRFDVANKTLTRTGSTEPLHMTWARWDTSGDRIVVREYLGARITLRDGRTGAVLAILREGPAVLGNAIVFLADGSIVLALRDDHESWLEEFSAQGKKLSRISLAGPGRIRLGGEWTAGRLLVGWVPDLGHGREGTSILDEVDVRQGTIRRVTEGLLPIFSWWREAPADPGTEATKLFLDANHSLVRFDPATGERRVLLGP